MFEGVCIILHKRERTKEKERENERERDMENREELKRVKPMILL